MKAGDVLVRVTQRELGKDVMADLTSSARGKRCNGALGKSLTQPAQLKVFGPEFMAPLRDAVCFINRKECSGDTLQPGQRVPPLQPFRREIEKPEGSRSGLPLYPDLILIAESAI